MHAMNTKVHTLKSSGLLCRARVSQLSIATLGMRVPRWNMFVWFVVVPCLSVPCPRTIRRVLSVAIIEMAYTTIQKGRPLTYMSLWERANERTFAEDEEAGDEDEVVGEEVVLLDTSIGMHHAKKG